MSFPVTALWRRHLALVLLGLTSLPLFAQQQQPLPPLTFSNRDAITTTLVKATNLGSGGSSGNSSPDVQWLKVEFHYSVNMPPGNPSLPRYLTEVQFKVWIEGRDVLDPQSTKPEEGTAVALTGSVTYVLVPASKDGYGVVYVHPNTLGRYCSLRGIDDFTRGKFDVHVEASVDGKVVDAIDKNREQDPNWYQQLKLVPNLVLRQNQSPFLNADPDRYPAIKLPEDNSK